MAAAAMARAQQFFGPHAIPASSIFYQTQLIFAIVNLKPLVPGHVLVCPKSGCSFLFLLSNNQLASSLPDASSRG